MRLAKFGASAAEFSVSNDFVVHLSEVVPDTSLLLLFEGVFEPFGLFVACDWGDACDFCFGFNEAVDEVE